MNNAKIIRERLFESLTSQNLNELALDIKTIIDSNKIQVKTINNKKPFVSKEILNYIKIKRNYGKLRMKYPQSDYIAARWKFYRNKVCHLCKKAKKKIFR